MNLPMNRRDALRMMAATLAAGTLARGRSTSAGEQNRGRLGVVVYCLGKQRGLMKKADPQHDLFEPVTYLEYCRELGAGGIQLPLGIRDETYCGALAEKARQYGMFVEGIVDPPRDKTDLDRFDREIGTVARAGARVVRTVIIPGRRYERFGSMEEFREFDRRGRESLRLAEPVAARHRVCLAVENHKDHRLEERVGMLEEIDSQWIRACVDFGNSFSLLEDPLETVRALAPWAASVHVKDQAVREYEDGFLLADIPLGQGFLDLKQMVAILRDKRPQLNFSLELITRDPLKVPCLVEDYWVTFGKVPGYELARTLRTVRSHAAVDLPYVGGLSMEAQAAMESENVKKSLAYAAAELGL